MKYLIFLLFTIMSCNSSPERNVVSRKPFYDSLNKALDEAKLKQDTMILKIRELAIKTGTLTPEFDSVANEVIKEQKLKK